MTTPNLFEITNGYFGLKLVDTTASGYTAAWQSPSGDVGSGVATTPILATLASYSTPATGWSATGWTCQVTSAQLTPRPSTTSVTRKATWCEPGATIPTPNESSFSADIAFYQDGHLRQSLSAFLFHNDATKAYVYMGMNGDSPPTLVGQVYLTPGAIGGAGRTPLEATASFQFVSKPLYERPVS